MARRRAKNLDDQTIKRIVDIIDGSTGVLTWQKLIDQVEMRLQSKYTRQALHRHERIRLAFESYRNRSRATEQRSVGPAEMVRVPAIRLARLEAENDRLQAENDRLLEQFVRWAYNAHTRGLDEGFLSRPLPPIDRKITRKPAGAKR